MINHLHFYDYCRDKGTWEWEYDEEPYIIDGIDEVHICYAIAHLTRYSHCSNIRKCWVFLTFSFKHGRLSFEFTM